MNANELSDATLTAAAINRARNAGRVLLGNEKEAAERRERLLVASGEHPRINLVTGYLDMVVIAQAHEREDRAWLHDQAKAVVKAAK